VSETKCDNALYFSLALVEAITILVGLMITTSLFTFPTARRGGAIGGIIRWFIMVVIYDIIISTIAEVLGVSRFTALFIFFGVLIAISIVGYILRKRMSGQADADI
jgi:hypothetical protein